MYDVSGTWMVRHQHALVYGVSGTWMVRREYALVYGGCTVHSFSGTSLVHHSYALVYGVSGTWMAAPSARSGVRCLWYLDGSPSARSGE